MTWERVTAPSTHDLTIDEAAAVEDVLAIAAAWEAGELPTDEALRLATATPRAIGTAFRFAWRDARRPALERLHMLEYGRREDAYGDQGWVYTNFGWVQAHVFDMVQRDMTWRKTPWNQ